MSDPRPLPPLKVPAFVRYLDLVVLVFVALPIFVLASKRTEPLRWVFSPRAARQAAIPTESIGPSFSRKSFAASQ